MKPLPFIMPVVNPKSKAVDYLLKSGEKCLERYAAEEAHQYFGKAYEITYLQRRTLRNR